MSQESVHDTKAPEFNSKPEHEHLDRPYHGVVAGKLMNPLAGISRQQLMRDVEIFAQQKGLEDRLDMLKKGALLSQEPMEYDSIDILSQEEKDSIRYEHANKWSHPFTLYATVFLCSVGAATQGWDQTGSNGANLSFPQDFGIEAVEGQPDYARNNWLQGVINSAPYIGSAFIGCWCSDPLNNWFGRRGTIFITAIILILTPIGSACTQTWQQLFVCRLLLGIGMGAKGSTVPVFAAENAPAMIRGTLVMGWQLWTAFGIFLGCLANVAVMNVTSVAAWRLQLGSAFIPAFPLAIGIFFCPESPRWLMKKNRYDKAYRSLVRLRTTELQAARDMYTIHVVLEMEKLIVRSDNYFTRFKELFTIPRVRRATLASGIVMLAQQMCGINIMSFYSSSIFSSAGFSTKQSLWASVGYGGINFAFAFPALGSIDFFGRRSLLLLTFPQMAWTLIVAGAAYQIPGPADSKTRLAVVVTFVYIFTAFYSCGEGPVPFAYSAEVFPLAQREQGMAWAVTVCLFFAAVLSITWPRMSAVMGHTGAFMFYAGLNVTAFILILLFVPETKQRTLEELDQIFSIPTGQFAAYQLKVMVPWWCRKYLLFQKNTPDPEPLYTIEGDVDNVPASQRRIDNKSHA
ncbi:sugar transporter [Pseudohyphozyma bogoriensis]|nr:sugar transporter [Pseudohyphozyma bogoriensis]